MHKRCKNTLRGQSDKRVR